MRGSARACVCGERERVNERVESKKEGGKCMHTDFCGFLHVCYVSTDVHFKHLWKDLYCPKYLYSSNELLMWTCQWLACRSVSLFLCIYFCFTAEPCRTDGSVGMRDFSRQSDSYPLVTSHALFPPFSMLGPTRILKLNDHASRYGTKWTFSPVSKTSFRLVVHHYWRNVYCMLIINGFQAVYLFCQ